MGLAGVTPLIACWCACTAQRRQQGAAAAQEGRWLILQGVGAGFGRAPMLTPCRVGRALRAATAARCCCCTRRAASTAPASGRCRAAAPTARTPTRWRLRSGRRCRRSAAFPPTASSARSSCGSAPPPQSQSLALGALAPTTTCAALVVHAGWLRACRPQSAMSARGTPGCARPVRVGRMQT